MHLPLVVFNTSSFHLCGPTNDFIATIMLMHYNIMHAILEYSFRTIGDLSYIDPNDCILK